MGKVCWAAGWLGEEDGMGKGTAHTVALAALQPGDQVLLQSGEMVPADGLIIDGVGWLRPAALPTTATLHKGVGDQVAATDIVLVGRLCVRVLSAP